MINTANIAALYEVLTTSITAKLDELYAAEKVDDETYAKLLTQSFDDALKLSVSATQQQQQIEKDLEVKQAQIAQINQQVLNMQAEKLRVDAQVAQVNAEILNLGVQREKLTQEVSNLAKQELQTVEQTKHVTQQTANLVSQKLQLEAQTLLVNQQTANALTENTTQIKQQCKLAAEFDVLMETKLKTATETALLVQKTATEKAQITEMGVDENSVIGRQKALYAGQTEGFKRDAEQKAAKLMIDTWNVRRTTDESTIAGQALDPVTNQPVGVNNRLGDADLARVVGKLISGVGA